MTEATNQAGSAPVHPASAALRQIADELDVLAAGGCAPPVTLHLNFNRENFSPVCRVLRLDVEPIPHDKRTDPLHTVSATRTVGGLRIYAWAWLRDLCVKRTVTRTVEEWVCGDEDAIVVDQAGSGS